MVVLFITSEFCSLIYLSCVDLVLHCCIESFRKPEKLTYLPLIMQIDSWPQLVNYQNSNVVIY